MLLKYNKGRATELFYKIYFLFFLLIFDFSTLPRRLSILSIHIYFVICY